MYHAQREGPADTAQREKVNRDRRREQFLNTLCYYLN